MSGIETDATGWSPTPLRIDLDDNKDYSLDSSYVTMTAHWFMKSWWTTMHRRWAKKFENKTAMKLKIKSMTFNCCPGNSRDGTSTTYKQFATSSGNLHRVKGWGCTFYAQVYKQGNSKAIAESGDAVLNPISQFNCSTDAEGAGATSKKPNKTHFGEEKYFKYTKVSNPTSPVPCTFKEFHIPGDVNTPTDIVVAPGESIFVVIHAKDWKASNPDVDTTSGDYGLLVIDSNSANWSSEIESEETPYIWVFNGTKWVKERVVFQLVTSPLTGKNEWTKIE